MNNYFLGIHQSLKIVPNNLSNSIMLCVDIFKFIIIQKYLITVIIVEERMFEQNRANFLRRAQKWNNIWGVPFKYMEKGRYNRK